MVSKFDEVKSKLKLSELVPGDKITFQSGIRYKICPICGGKNSFSIIPEGYRGNTCEIFKCFKCDNHGSIIDYYCVINGLDQSCKINQSKALKELSNEFKLNRLYEVKDNLPKSYKKENKPIKQYDFTALAEDLHKNLVDKERFIFKVSDDADMASNYYRERGLSDDVIKRFKLGYCLFGIDSAFSDFPELCSSKIDIFYNYFIPIYENGKCIYILPRLCENDILNFYKEEGLISKNIDFPKTKNLKGVPIEIFNFEGALKSEIVFITEGWCDALSIETLGYSALSLNGISNINKFINKLKKVKNFNNKFYIIAFDRDISGINARVNLEKSLMGLKCRVYHLMPSGNKVKDINDMLINNRDELKIEINRLINKINLRENK